MARQPIEVIVALGENERRATLTRSFDNVTTNELIANIIVDELSNQSLKVDSLIRVVCVMALKRRGADDGRMFEGPRGSLRLGTHTVSNRTTLHSNDRMMAVVARN